MCEAVAFHCAEIGQRGCQRNLRPRSRSRCGARAGPPPRSRPPGRFCEDSRTPHSRPATPRNTRELPCGDLRATPPSVQQRATETSLAGPQPPRRFGGAPHPPPPGAPQTPGSLGIGAGSRRPGPTAPHDGPDVVGAGRAEGSGLGKGPSPPSGGLWGRTRPGAAAPPEGAWSAPVTWARATSPSSQKNPRGDRAARGRGLLVPQGDSTPAAAAPPASPLLPWRRQHPGSLGEVSLPRGVTRCSAHSHWLWPRASPEGALRRPCLGGPGCGVQVSEALGCTRPADAGRQQRPPVGLVPEVFFPLLLLLCPRGTCS